MDKFERVRAALWGNPVDPPPLSLWRHFHQRDRDPSTLAEATAAFARRYDLDLVKLTPSGLYAVEDWGAEIVYPVDQDPASPDTATQAPYLAQPAIAEARDWRTLRQHGTAALDRELQAIRLTRERLGPDWPMVMTIFSPLTLAYKLAGENLRGHLQSDPEALHVGLRILTAVTTAFAHAALAAGADGLFFASQWMSGRFCTREQYETFGLAYDMEILESAGPLSRITILHLHGTDIFFDLADAYPVDALSWHDRETPPSLAEAREQTGLAFITGLDRDLLRNGPPQAIVNQARDAIAQAAGHGLILAPACVIPPDTPETHLRAIAEETGRDMDAAQG
jgi:uroporphyrinogen decarboxylase